MKRDPTRQPGMYRSRSAAAVRAGRTPASSSSSIVSGGERGRVDEQRAVAGARVGEVRVAGGVDDDEPAPASTCRSDAGASRAPAGGRATCGASSAPVDRVRSPGREDARPVGDLAVARQPARLRELRACSRRGIAVTTPTIPCVPSPRSSTNATSNATRLPSQAGSSRPGECAKRTSRHGAGRVRPPRVDGPVGEREVGGQVAEEIEGQRWRPQELGPQSLVIEALVGLDDGRAGPRRLECARR